MKYTGGRGWHGNDLPGHGYLEQKRDQPLARVAALHRIVDLVGFDALVRGQGRRPVSTSSP